MQILKIDHLGIAVNSIDEGKNFWSDILGLEFEGAETVTEQKVTTAFFPVGESEVELLESTACRVLFIEKSRRVGLTWGLPCYAVLRAGPARGAPAGGRRVRKPAEACIPTV